MNNFSRAELIEIVDEAISKNGMESGLPPVESEYYKIRVLLENLHKKFDLMLEMISPKVKKVDTQTVAFKSLEPPK